MKDSQTISQGKKIRLKGIIKYVYKKVGKAILDYQMIKENDRILVAVSGGSDSLSLLKLLNMRKRRIPISFDIIACFIKTNFIDIDEEKVIEYFKKEGIPFLVKELNLEKKNLDCFWCSWNRRKILFETAQIHNCNKIALGHHLDDIVETILMNLFFFGEISAMKPKISFFKDKLEIIRPLCYLEKEELKNFVYNLEIPFADYECPYGKDSRRELVKLIIKETKNRCPYVKKNIFRALGRIKKDYLL